MQHEPGPDAYTTLAVEGVHEVEINRSRFRCALAPVADEEAARAFIARVREDHPGAHHNCWAYVVGASAGVQKSSDDGEPGGTAGMPMLQMLLRREVRYVAAVVTRYFGGVKLGAGGLIRAYGGVVGEALDTLGTVRRRRYRLVTVTLDHQRAGRLERDLRAGSLAVREVRYGAEVELDVGVPEGELPSFRDWLADATAGAARLDTGDEEFFGS